MQRTRQTASAVNVVTVAETVAVATPAIDASAGDPVDIEATLDVTVGGGGTSITVKVERGGAVGGAVVATFGPYTVVAGNRVNLSVNATDQQPGDVAGQQYVVTVQVTAAAGNSTVNNAYVGVLY